MKIFVSHVREEKRAAVALKEQLEAALPGVTVWVSSIDLGLGHAWLRALENELEGAKALLVLCGSQPARKPWINFESGFGYGKRMRVIPVCHRGLGKQQLPYPLSIFQACEAADPEEYARLVQQLAEGLKVEIAKDFTPEAITKGLTPRVVRGQGIGLILAHGQPDWEKTGDSPFRRPHALPEAGRDRWTFRRILSEDKIAAAALDTLSGIIVGSPWRSTMSAECVDELVEWVHAGGRLLLLGFELGDRHHGGNLGDLARRFGIHPMVDIVGPCDYGQKPYGIWMDFKPDVAPPPPLTMGLDRIRLCNVQTVMVEPGGDEWLRVGQHAVYRPAGKDVQYWEGQLTQPKGAQFEVKADAA